MKRTTKIALLVLALSLSCSDFSYAQESQPNVNSITPITVVAEASIPANPIVGVSNVTPPILVAPIVEDPNAKKNTESKKPIASRKIDLKAIIFDPTSTLKAEAEAEGREMTRSEAAQYNIHEALHGEVSAVSTKGLLADKMKMTFDKGPIDTIVPWMDYNGYLSNIWKGDNFENTLYGINFADAGVNINMKDKKTFVRFMVSPVKTYAGKNYFQSFFADNYLTYKLTKNNTVLIGNTWVPLGIEGKESPLVWQFFNRSQTSLAYSSVRTLGTKLMGNYKYVDYQAGFSSSGRGFSDWFPGEEFTGWVEFKPLANTKGKYGKLTVGMGANGGNAQWGRYNVATGAINYEYKRLRAITEFGMADGSNGALGYSPYKSQGINGTLSYRVTPKFQALVRYDQFDPNTEKSNNMRTEYTAGINYFIKGQALKLMLNYVYYTLENGTSGSRIMTGTQFVL